MSTIFTGFKNPDPDLRIPLLFMEKDEDVERWIQIDKNFLLGMLPDGGGPYSKGKRKPLAYTDYKPLYGLRNEDLNYLADLVERGIVCMKTTKLNQDILGMPVIPIGVAAGREKKVRAMKNELMCHYKQHPLPSKKPEYIPYSAAQWDEFADEKKITRDQVQWWVDKTLATDVGSAFLDGRTRALNKTCDPHDCPPAVIAMWESYFNAHAGEEVEAAASHDFDNDYDCRVMDDRSWDISKVLTNTSVKAWRGEGKTHMYFWFLFEVTGAGPRAKLLEYHKLKRLFDALEYRDVGRQLLSARSPAVLMTDAVGFHDVLTHLQRRREECKVRVWDWHVIHYIPDRADGFPKPIAGTHYSVYLFFLFAFDEELGSTRSFNVFFPGKTEMSAVYKSSDMEVRDTLYRRPALPWFSISAALEIFADHLTDNMVIVNVNGGPEFTYLGLVRLLHIYRSVAFSRHQSM